MSKIKDGLYIGNSRDSQNRIFLVNNKITHILCSAVELRPMFRKEYKYLHVRAQDNIYYNLMKHFHEAADFIQQSLASNGRVLVHCFAGVSRSTSLVLAYLIKYEGMTFKEGLALCRGKRPIVNPNPSFVSQLKKWEAVHLRGAQDDQGANLELPKRETYESIDPKLLSSRIRNLGKHHSAIPLGTKKPSVSRYPRKNTQLSTNLKKPTSNRGPSNHLTSPKNALKSYPQAQKPSISPLKTSTQPAKKPIQKRSLLIPTNKSIPQAKRPSSSVYKDYLKERLDWRISVLGEDKRGFVSGKIKR